MEITREQTGKLTANIHLHIEPADYKPQVDAELKKQAKKANMPGFRPGKVPVNVVRRMVGRQLVVETLNDVVNQALNDYIRDEELNLLGSPIPTDEKTEDDFPLAADQPLDFHFAVGLAPEITVDYDLPETPKRYEVEVDDAYLDKEIDQYRERFGGVTQPEEVAEGDIFYGKLYEVDADGNPIEEGFEQMVPFNPMRMDAPEFFAGFVGATIDSDHPVDVKQISEDPKTLAGLLFVDESEVPALLEKNTRVQVKRINRLGNAELNAEFFGRMAEELGWEDVNPEEMDEAAFRDKMRESLAEQATEPARWEYLEALREKLLAHHPLELPDDFLKTWLQQPSREGETKTAEEVEKEYPEFAEAQTWSLIVDEIMRQNPELKVEEEELQEQMVQDLRRMLGGMGQPLAPEQEAQYLQMMAQNREMVNQSYSRVLTHRIFDHLEEKIEPKETEPITATAYFEMKEKERAEKEANRVEEVLEEVQQAAAEDASRPAGDDTASE